MIDLANVKNFNSALLEIGSILRFTIFAVMLNFKVVGLCSSGGEGEGLLFNFLVFSPDQNASRFKVAPLLIKKKCIAKNEVYCQKRHQDFNKHLLSCFMLLIFESCVKCSLQ